MKCPLGAVIGHFMVALALKINEFGGRNAIICLSRSFQLWPHVCLEKCTLCLCVCLGGIYGHSEAHQSNFSDHPDTLRGNLVHQHKQHQLVTAVLSQIGAVKADPFLVKLARRKKIPLK